MTTDRTAPARPAALAERPANGPRKQEQAPDVFAQILGTKAPADQPKRSDAPRDRAHAHKTDAKDKPADDAAKPAADQANAATDPNAVVTPDAPVQPVEPLPVTPEQLVAQLASPLPAPSPQPGDQPVAPIQAPVNGVPAATQAPAQPVVTPQPAQPPVATAPEPQQPTQAPAEPTTDPAVPTAETPVPAAPIKTDDVKLPQAPVAGAQHAQSAAPAGAPAQPNAGDTGQQPSQQQPEQTAAPAPTPSTAHIAEAPKAEAPAEPQPVQPAPAPAQAATAAERAVPLYRAPQVAAAVIHLAQQHGVTHVRINLKPAELGGIEVRLHSSPQGLSAHLIADSPEAAKALHQASDDLRRQLESRDVTLLSLDVSTSNGDDQRQAGFGADAGRDGGSSAPSGRYGRRESEQPAEAPAETTLVLPDGVLVDVLA